MQHRKPPEEHSVSRHGLQDSGSHEDHEVEESERRHRNARRDDLATGRSQQRMHHVGSWSSACRQPVDTEHAQIRDVREQIDHHDDRHAVYQRLGQVAFRLNDLFGDEVRLLPTTVGEEDRDQCGSDAGGQRRG